MASIPDRPPPSTFAIVFATALLAGVGGFFLGQASSIGLFGSSSRRTRGAHNKERNGGYSDESSEEEQVDEDEEFAPQPQELSDFNGAGNEECKLVLVVRTDLGMTKGAYL